MKIKDLDTCSRAYITPSELANYLTVNVRTVYHWIAKGALVALKIERTVRISIVEARRITRLHRIEMTHTPVQPRRDRSDTATRSLSHS